MTFQLEKSTQVVVTNVNARPEMHGTDLVRALDIAFKLEGPNTLLDLIEPGLREHHFYNAAHKAGQRALMQDDPLPDVRHKKLPMAYPYDKGGRYRNYRWVWDWGTNDPFVDFTDAVLANLHYEFMEGGSCIVYFTVQYNGDELQDDKIYGRLCGLATEHEIWITLLAPGGDPVPARKGQYRAGRPDTPPPAAANPKQAKLEDGSEDGSGGSDESGSGTGDPDPFGHAPDSPEAALARAHGGNVTINGDAGQT